MSSSRTLSCSVLACGLALIGSGVASAQAVNVTPQSLSFVYQTGGPNPASLQVASDQILTVPSQTFHVTTHGGSWLQASPTGGVTNALVNVSASTTGLAAGYYLGLVSIEIPGVATSQQFVPVVLVVSPGF